MEKTAWVSTVMMSVANPADLESFSRDNKKAMFESFPDTPVRRVEIPFCSLL